MVWYKPSTWSKKKTIPKQVVKKQYTKPIGPTRPSAPKTPTPTVVTKESTVKAGVTPTVVRRGGGISPAPTQEQFEASVKEAQEKVTVKTGGLQPQPKTKIVSQKITGRIKPAQVSSPSDQTLTRVRMEGPDSDEPGKIIETRRITPSKEIPTQEQFEASVRDAERLRDKSTRSGREIVGKALQFPEQQLRRYTSSVSADPRFDIVAKRGIISPVVLSTRYGEQVKSSLGIPTAKPDAPRVVGGGAVIDTGTFFIPGIAPVRAGIFTSYVAGRTTESGVEYIKEEPIEFAAGALVGGGLIFKGTRAVKAAKKVRDIERAETGFLAAARTKGDVTGVKVFSQTKVGKDIIGTRGGQIFKSVGDDVAVGATKKIQVARVKDALKQTEVIGIGATKSGPQINYLTPSGEFISGRSAYSKVITTPTRTRKVEGIFRFPGRVKRATRELRITETTGAIQPVPGRESFYVYKGIEKGSRLDAPSIRGLIKVGEATEDVGSFGGLVLRPTTRLTPAAEKAIALEATAQRGAAITSVKIPKVPKTVIPGGQVFERRPETKTQVTPKSIQAQRETQRTIVSSAVSPATSARMRSRQVQKPKQKQKTLVQTTTALDTKTSQRFVPPISFEIQQVAPLSFGFSPTGFRGVSKKVLSIIPTFKSKPIKATKQKAYDVQAKDKGKWQTLNKKSLSRAAAKDLGARATDNTTSKRFRIQPSRKKNGAAGGDSYFIANQNKFRPYKIQKGRKVPLRESYIERTGFGIDTRGEKQGLSLAKWRKQQQQTLFSGNPFAPTKKKVKKKVKGGKKK